jgi:trigger factor
MHTVVEPLEGNKVKLSIELDEQEFEQALDAAFRKISREVRIPGFRPGKAPRRVLEARIGSEVARQEALRDGLPEFYVKALREQDLDAIAAPQIDITGGEESGPVVFEAVVELRPQLSLPGYGGLQVSVPTPVATDADIDAQIDRLRGNFGELNVVDRPVIEHDHVTIDVQGSLDGESIPQLNRSDFLYEVGTRSLIPELDDKLLGAGAGDEIDFEADVAGTIAQVKVQVKEVKEKVLPEATDEWASEASEFDTLAELRSDLAQRLGTFKASQTNVAVRNGALESLVALVDVELPEALIQTEVERRVRDLSHRLEHDHLDLGRFLAITGQTQESFLEGIRSAAVETVKVDLALRAVAEAEDLQVDDDEVDDQIARMAANYRVKPSQLRRELDKADQVPSLRADLRKAKALEWLVEHVEVVDEEGRVIDRSLFQPAGAGDTEVPAAASEGEDPSDQVVGHSGATGD